ncbi:tRNA pseudouridine(38-40) synthase TruA [bacterium]|nr:tRNA pseudouridine(38-40) synthase TruA [bacterium]
MRDDAMGRASGLDDEAYRREFPVRVRIDLAYVGTDFHGWQVQPEHRTVQGVLSRALERLLGYPVLPVGAGRTDTGVHARGQVAHLDVRSVEELERLQRALGGMMPRDVAVNAVTRAAPDFNARLSAAARLYRYRILMGRDIFQPHCWQIDRPLDREAMDEGAAALLGRHDFTSFCKTTSLKEDGNGCTVDLCGFQWEDRTAIFAIRANRFLHHMVRIIVGTLVEIGRGSRPRGSLTAVLAARDRSAAGSMAPAAGLFLEEVTYPDPCGDSDEGVDP